MGTARITALVVSALSYAIPHFEGAKGFGIVMVQQRRQIITAFTAQTLHLLVGFIFGKTLNILRTIMENPNLVIIHSDREITDGITSGRKQVFPNLSR